MFLAGSAISWLQRWLVIVTEAPSGALLGIFSFLVGMVVVTEAPSGALLCIFSFLVGMVVVTEAPSGALLGIFSFLVGIVNLTLYAQIAKYFQLMDWCCLSVIHIQIKLSLYLTTISVYLFNYRYWEFYRVAMSSIEAVWTPGWYRVLPVHCVCITL